MGGYPLVVDAHAVSILEITRVHFFETMVRITSDGKW